MGVAKPTYSILVTTTDSVKVSSVSPNIDGVIRSTVNRSSLSYNWSPAYTKVGAHTVMATAKDSSGKQSSKSIPIYFH